MKYLSEVNRIGVLMFVDPTLGITLEQAEKTLSAVIDFNSRQIKYAAGSKNIAAPQTLSRLGFTGQKSTATNWEFLLEFMAYASQQGQPPVHIYSDLKELVDDGAMAIRDARGRLYGEWFAPSLDSRGIEIMVGQGFKREEAEKILAGILVALETGALTGLEFQINKRNIGYVEDFIKTCRQLGIEPHLEMQEIQFSRNQDNLATLRNLYRNNLPSRAEILKVANFVAQSTHSSATNLLSPFFDYGGPHGVCNYWFENGLFIRPQSNGDLYRTVCLSDQTIIDSDFKPTVLNLIKNLEHPLMKSRQSDRDNIPACQGCKLLLNCRGGCRAMAYLFSGDDSSPDPNCWRVE